MQSSIDGHHQNPTTSYEQSGVHIAASAHHVLVFLRIHLNAKAHPKHIPSKAREQPFKKGMDRCAAVRHLLREGRGHAIANELREASKLSDTQPCRVEPMRTRPKRVTPAVHPTIFLPTHQGVLQSL